MNATSRRAKAIFVDLIRDVSPSEWDDRLKQACEGDDELRCRVADLLAAHARTGSFLDEPAVAVEVTVEHETVAPGTIIGPYKLMEVIGEGGMGTVYMAEQHEPVRRKVALKVIKPGMDSKQVIARFEAERQALAMMDHPNIARVLDGGTTPEGRPYFVMELVRGIPITDYCDREQLSIPERLELFVLVCRAVQHAHQKGIIHRDIKPSNVLVTEIDGAAAPKVIDFGVAKATGQSLTDRTLYTGFHQFVGTPLYTSPEQADLSGVDVDTRSDIYSLGVLLYELLTGTTPFDSETLRRAAFDEMRRIIREEEPPRPSTRLSSLGERLSTVSSRRKADPKRLGSSLRGELDWVVMKALEKDHRRRYETANDFAADVMRYLTDQPVEACSPSAWYRLSKFTRRNRKGLVSLALASVSGLIVAFVLGAVYLRDVNRVRQVTQDVRQALAGARTAIEARDLTLAGQRASEARGRLGVDESSLPDLAAEIAGVRREIDARKDDAARLDRFLKEASDLQDQMSFGLELQGPAGLQAVMRVAEEVLGLYGILTEKDWLSRLETSYLTADQKRQVRETAYVTLVSLADFEVRWPGLREAPESVARSLDLLRRAEAFHEPTRAFYFVRAECRRRQGDAAAAEADERQFKAATARTAWDEFLPGHTAGWRGDLDESTRSYQAALRLQPDHFNSLFFLANRFDTDKINRRPEAVQLYTACLALRPDHMLSWLNRGVALARLGQWDDAMADYRQAIRRVPDDGRAHVNIGIILEKQGKGDEAIAAYREAIRLEPGLASAHNNLGNALGDQGKVDEAIAAYREAIRLKPDLAEAHNNLGVALNQQGKVDEAIAAYREAIRLKPDLSDAHNNFGNALRNRGKLDEAITEYREAIRLPSDFPGDAHAGLGKALQAQGKVDEAIAEYRKAIHLQPGLASAHNNLGAILCDVKRDYGGAVACFREAIALDPKYAFAHHNLGIALKGQGKVEEAIAALREAIRLQPDYADAHYHLGNLLEEHGKVDEAIAALREAIRLQPGLASAHNNLGAILCDVKRDYGGAIACFLRAIELDPEYDAAHGNLGIALSRQGKWDEAIVEYREAIRLGPSQANYQNGLAWFLANCPDPRFRDPTQAVDLARKAVELAPRNGGYRNTLGVALYRAGDWQAAVAALEKSMELGNGGDASDWWFLAMAHCQLGRKDEARTWYDKALAWMEKHPTKDEELLRFRAEAAALMGIKPSEPEKTSAAEPPGPPI